ncbi:Repressor of differentiation kinase 1 [Trypanosoma brucei equiperdum]|uniref:Repressor of differentiation kinase 1 n=1 Tax=Trypanosoma brucei equiperdum TaxID=630700 RepID=A0A3L6KW06_9TRYP|nr:Repressor of differentiation kinase 1 [Trypanosoma brucei equiperdum]
MTKEDHGEEMVTHTPQVLNVRTTGESVSANPLRGVGLKDCGVFSPTSSTFCDTSRLMGNTGRSVENSTVTFVTGAPGKEEADRRHCRVGTIAAVALLMLTGVFTLSFTSLLSAHYIGSSVVIGTTGLIEKEAVRSVVKIMRSTVLQLPDFAHIVNAKYIRNQTSLYTVNRFPKDPRALLYSLMSLLSTFKDTIAYFKFVHEGGSYAFAVNYDVGDGGNNSVVLGAYNNDSSRASFVVYDAIRLKRLHEDSNRNWDISHDLSRTLSPFGAVARQWHEGGSNKRWIPSEIEHTGEYFNYVIPFHVGGALGACIVGLSTDRLLLESRPLVEALRSHGRAMLFDDSRDIVILNSWGQPQSWDENPSDGELVFKHLTLEGINDSIVVDLIREMEKHRDPTTDRLSDSVELTFPNSGSHVDGRLGRITDESGLDVTLAVVTMRSDFLEGVVRTRNVTIVSISVIILLSAVFSLVSTYYLVKPLMLLVSALKSASNLEIPDNADIFLGRSRIVEVRKIQGHYAKLRRQLAVLLKFIPEAILARVESKNEAGGHIRANGSATETPGESSTAFVRIMGASISVTWTAGDQQRDVALNCGIFKEKPNVFNRRHCTVIAIQVYHPDVWKSSTKYHAALIEVATEHSGCVEALDPDRALISFGAHAALPMHCRRCCQFAFDLFAKLPLDHRDSVTMLVDTNEFLVGTCGAFSRNARVLFGADHLFQLSHAVRDGPCRIAATSGGASHMQGFLAFPVDCVLLPCSTLPIVLFELRPGESSSEVSLSISKQFRLGFAAMRQGRYGEAMAHYLPMVKMDMQAKRLMRLCRQRCRRNDTVPYVRVLDNHYCVNSSDCKPEEQDESDIKDRVPETIDSPRRPDGEGSESDSSDQGSESLFKMYAPSSSSSLDGSGCAEGANAADVVPLFLTDSNRNVWTRSLKKISEGAFSTIFLGVAEDGAQVAIKCIPRLRRDVVAESLEKEMEVASKLHHPNIVRYVSCSITPSHLSIIMEYVPGGSLHSVIKNFGCVSPYVARRFTVDILQGLNYLHNLGIVHCDVKPHNVLLGTDGVCKLSDFGSTISEASVMARTLADGVMLRGTALYMAPEVAAGGRCTPQSDIFSFGISLLEMLLGRPPWQWSSTAPAGSDATRLRSLFNRDLLFVQSLALGHLEPVIPASVDHEAAAFVRACCHMNPSMKPSASSLLSYAFLL